MITSSPLEYTYKFLWNIVDGRNIPDETEHRLRIRYALVSAVEALGYLPFRESALKQVAVEIPDPDNQASASPDGNNQASVSKIQVKIGCFETFIKQADSQSGLPDRVCLIWERKDFYRKYNFKTVNNIVGQTIKNIRAEDNAAPPATPVYFLHHGTSDDLSKYLYDYSISRESFPTDPISFTYATMFMASPTPSCLKRPVVTDNKLVKALVKELKLRIPQLSVPNGSKDPRIVIFTESNTKYGREMVLQLEKKLKKLTKSARQPEVYTYLSGLDGLSNDLRSNVASNTANPGLEASGTPSSETTFGTSQFDYLRRTARWLRGKTSRNSSEHISAVGVLGTDIYDKMVVLQAIRQELPSAIFFTTDLDALYLSTETELARSTRNLVIASGDGLDLEEIETSQVTKASPAATASPATVTTKHPGPWKLPPMRDSYQSMLVREVQRILASKDSDKCTNPPKNPPKKFARVYEITSGKYVCLNPDCGRGWETGQMTETTHSECLLRILAHWQINPILFFAGLINAFAILGAIFAVFDRLYLYRPFGYIRQAYRSYRKKMRCRAQSGVPPVVAASELTILICHFLHLICSKFPLLAAFLRSPSRRRAGKERTLISDRSVILLAAELAVALFFVVIILLKLFSADEHRFLFEEPMDLGVSIWPSIMIRLFAFIAAILLLMAATHSFVSWRSTSARQLLTAASPRPSRDESGNAISRVARMRTRTSDARGLLRIIVALLRIIVARPSSLFRLLKTRLRRSDSGKASLKKALDHWITLLISPRRRFWRIVKHSIWYLLFSLCLFMIWQPTTPGRTGGVLFFEKVVLAFGVGLYVIHLIFCIDLHWSAYKLLHTIRKCLLLLEDPRRSKNVPQIDLPVLSEAVASLTNVIGRTLLYPLTVLILIILSRLPIFDNWRMTTSLFLTFAFGALLLVTASLLLWYEGAQFKKALIQLNKSRSNLPSTFDGICKRSRKCKQLPLAPSAHGTVNLLLRQYYPLQRFSAVSVSPSQS